MTTPATENATTEVAPASPSSAHIPLPSPAAEITPSVHVPDTDGSDDGDFQDVADDRFSMIPLQTPTAAATKTLQFEETNKTDSADTSPRLRGSSVSSVTGQKSPNGSLRARSPTSTHRTSLPPSSGGPSRDSTSRMPFMLARQKERLDSDPHAHRASIDGHARLKEGFDKIQQVTQTTESEIDWGTLLSVAPNTTCSCLVFNIDFWGVVIAGLSP